MSLTIATVGVQAAPVLPVGVAPSGEMEAPDGIHEVGWYSKSASPADDSGALLLDGHVGLEGQSAVFKELHRLKTGSIIKLTAQDGSTYSYEVYHVEQMALEDVDMRKMLRSVNPSKQGLNIITCAGEYDATRRTYDDRVLVYAVKV